MNNNENRFTPIFAYTIKIAVSRNASPASPRASMSSEGDALASRRLRQSCNGRAGGAAGITYRASQASWQTPTPPPNG